VPKGQIGMRTEYRTSGYGGEPLVLEGLPDGLYDIRIRCEGYKPLEGLPAMVRDNILTDLGELRLNPTGIVDITVVGSR